MRREPVILKGNCLDTLKTLPDCSIDSIVTDPPYELGFMGKSWDNSGIAYNVEMWRECLRVLKPGGHLLAFSGSRTYHRMTVAIEDAGFEIRDQIMWLYGSGFPKSLDVSKAIDKGMGENRQRQLRFTEWMRSTGITAKQIDEATGTNMGGHYLSSASQPAIATADLFDLLRPLLPEVPEEIERLVAERTGIEWTAYKNRKVVGSKESNLLAVAPGQDNDRSATTLDITAPATPEAQRWQGWGTALKPAHEPICVARKPLTGTVASNVLEWGTGALNIDGSRVEHNEPIKIMKAQVGGNKVYGQSGRYEETTELKPEGRWPANVIHDGSDEVLAGFPNDAGRFFYCAKASKSERNAGLEGLPEQITNTKTPPGTKGSNSPRAGAGRTGGAQNFHPTVKPLALMRYLIKLVTPPGGTVLDPFLGSGSTAVAAILEGFDWVGCEMTEDYWPIIEARVQWAENQPRTLL